MNEIIKEFQTGASARQLGNAHRLGGEAVPVPGRSPAARAGTTARWLGRLQSKLHALGSDQGREKHFKEILLQNQEDCEPESCPSRQFLLHSKMHSLQICTFLKINTLASNTPNLSHFPS